MALLCAIQDPMGRGGHLWHVGGILPTIQKGVDKISPLDPLWVSCLVRLQNSRREATASFPGVS